MNMRQLQYFVSVYNEKSFKTAAEFFSVSPQGINKMIKTLEAETGEKLFLRKGNSIVPTQAAHDLMPYAMRLIEDYSAIETRYRQKRSIVSVCSIDSIIDYYLSGFVPSFILKHPDISLKIIEVTNDEAITRIRKKECDFAILQEDFHTSEIQNSFLFISPFVILAHKDHPVSNKDFFTDSDFNRVHLAARGTEYIIYDRTMKHLFSKNIHPLSVLESNNERLLVDLVRRNLAVAAVNEAVANHYKTTDLKIIPIENHSVHDYISISYYTEQSTPSRIFFEELMEWIHSHIATKWLSPDR